MNLLAAMCTVVLCFGRACLLAVCAVVQCLRLGKRLWFNVLDSGLRKKSALLRKLKISTEKMRAVSIEENKSALERRDSI